VTITEAMGSTVIGPEAVREQMQLTKRW